VLVYNTKSRKSGEVCSAEGFKPIPVGCSPSKIEENEVKRRLLKPFPAQIVALRFRPLFLWRPKGSQTSCLSFRTPIETNSSLCFFYSREKWQRLRGVVARFIVKALLFKSLFLGTPLREMEVCRRKFNLTLGCKLRVSLFDPSVKNDHVRGRVATINQVKEYVLKNDQLL